MRTSFRAIAFWLLASFASLAWKGTIGFATPLPAFQSSANDTRNQPGKSHPTSEEIAEAKTKSLVWVNTATRVYHKSTSPRYGATEHGKFMTEEDAKKDGYRIADESRSQRIPQNSTKR